MWNSCCSVGSARSSTDYCFVIWPVYIPLDTPWLILSGHCQGFWFWSSITKLIASGSLDHSVLLFRLLFPLLLVEQGLTLSAGVWRLFCSSVRSAWGLLIYYSEIWWTVILWYVGFVSGGLGGQEWHWRLVSGKTSGFWNIYSLSSEGFWVKKKKKKH